METEVKTDIDEVQANVNLGVGYEVPKTRSIRSVDLILRLAAVASTLIAAAVMGSASQTKDNTVLLADLTTTVIVRVTAKSLYSSSFVYFLVVNAIACAYSVLSLVIIFTGFSKPVTTKGFAFVIGLLDLVMVALLSSGNGAAAAIGLVGAKGNSHAGWNKICNVYGKFCRQVMAGIAISMIALVVFFLLVILSVVKLNRRSR